MSVIMALDYALAKKLQDTDFPQGGNGTWIVPPDKIVVRRQDRVYSPTLSELIRSCGSAFSSLHRDDDSWEARSIPALGGDLPPVEATLRKKLWLVYGLICTTRNDAFFCLELFDIERRAIGTRCPQLAKALELTRHKRRKRHQSHW